MYCGDPFDDTSCTSTKITLRYGKTNIQENFQTILSHIKRATITTNLVLIQVLTQVLIW